MTKPLGTEENGIKATTRQGRNLRHAFLWSWFEGHNFGSGQSQRCSMIEEKLVKSRIPHGKSLFFAR